MAEEFRIFMPANSDKIRKTAGFRAFLKKIINYIKRKLQDVGLLKEVYPNSALYPKGQTLIISNYKFQNAQHDRLGNEYDEARMEEMFTKFGYDVQIEKNQTAKEMVRSIQRFSKNPQHWNCGSAIVVILSHGSQNDVIFGIDGEEVLIDAFITPLNSDNCEALEGKPKLFFTGACRGSQHTNMVRIKRGWLTRIFDKIQKMLIKCEYSIDEGWRKNPANKDFCVMYATLPNFVSWREPKNGTFFIQAICDVFNSFAEKENVMEMMNKVTDQVYKHECQTPCYAHTLTKDFYFFAPP